MSDDPEIAAMSAVAEVLAPLDDGGRRRVLVWAASRFELSLGSGARVSAREAVIDGVDERAREFGDFVDLFDAATPKTEPERALVGGYWFQVGEGANDFQAQQVNDALKDVGHGVSNITDALTKLQRRRPALVRQVAKSGRARQARKRYRLTTAGITAVTEMVAHSGGEEA